MENEKLQPAPEEIPADVETTDSTDAVPTTKNTPKKHKSGKKILIAAAALVLLILLIGKAAKGGSSGDAEKEVKQFLQSMNYQVTNVKTEYKTKYKVKNVDDNKWENAVYTLVSATLMDSYSGDVQYVLVSCEICKGDPADIDVEYQTDSKGVLKNVIRTNIEDTKQLIQDLKDSGELR